MATDGVVSENDSSFPEFRIVLLGPNRAEKTSVGNTILGEEKFNVQTAAQCVKREGEVGGRHVTVVDTLGWWSGHHTENTLNQIKEITLSGSMCAPGPHAFLLVLPIQTVYTEKDRVEAEEHMRLFGEGVWRHTLVLFTKGDSLGERTIEQYIESKGNALQWLTEKCGNRYHLFNNMNRADDSQVTELMEKIEKMVAVNSGLHYEIEKKSPDEMPTVRIIVTSVDSDLPTSGRTDFLPDEKKRLHETGQQSMRREEELPSDEGIDLTRKKEDIMDIMQTGKRTVTVGNNSPKLRRQDCIPDRGGENTSVRYKAMSESPCPSPESITSSGYGSCISIPESTESETGPAYMTPGPGTKLLQSPPAPTSTSEDHSLSCAPCRTGPRTISLVVPPMCRALSEQEQSPRIQKNNHLLVTKSKSSDPSRPSMSDSVEVIPPTKR